MLLSLALLHSRFVEHVQRNSAIEKYWNNSDRVDIQIINQRRLIEVITKISILFVGGFRQFCDKVIFYVFFLFLPKKAILVILGENWTSGKNIQIKLA